jgi:hypothetical protein
MQEIALVHLVWKPAGIEAFQRFVAAYREQAAGVEHSLVVAYKAFDGPELAEYRRVLGSTSHSELSVPNRGMDIGAYCWIAERTEAHYLCFVNSYAAPLAANWLRILRAQLTRPGIGAVAATGSWESAYTNYLRRLDEVGPPSTPMQWAKHLNRLRKLSRYRKHFVPAPNPHLRTNAVMIERSLWLSLRPRRIRNKWDALLFESGIGGMTSKLLAQGLDVVVTGRDGRAYRRKEWPESGTFRTGPQENLLVADNRTRQYDQADAEGKRLLSLLAWGAPM